jgi:hypothetical protein
MFATEAVKKHETHFLYPVHFAHMIYGFCDDLIKEMNMPELLSCVCVHCQSFHCLGMEE